MSKAHPSLIFYFIINIVIFTSCAAGDDLYERYENLFGKLSSGEKAASDDSKVVPRGTNLGSQQSASLSNGFKIRREIFSDIEPTSNVIDDRESKEFLLGDSKLLEILEDLQTRDANGQRSMTKANDTFNGKLIPCFIHPLPSFRRQGRKFIVLLFC